jgi:hypothetical protein
LDGDADEATREYDRLDDSWKPTFVSSIASNHFKEGRKMVQSIANHYPDSKIILFDIGLKAADVSFYRFFFKYPPF